MNHRMGDPNENEMIIIRSRLTKNSSQHRSCTDLQGIPYRDDLGAGIVRRATAKVVFTWLEPG
jgi:hypothetical protein